MAHTSIVSQSEPEKRVPAILPYLVVTCEAPRSHLSTDEHAAQLRFEGHPRHHHCTVSTYLPFRSCTCTTAQFVSRLQQVLAFHL